MFFISHESVAKQFFMSFTPTPHPILKLPTLKEAELLGPQKWGEMVVQREKLIAEEKNDMLRRGWEPTMWRICDALLDWPWLDPAENKLIRERLGFKRVVDVLLINGGDGIG